MTVPVPPSTATPEAVPLVRAEGAATPPTRLATPRLQLIAALASVVGGAWAIWTGIHAFALVTTSLVVWQKGVVPWWYGTLFGLQLLLHLSIVVCLVFLGRFVLALVRRARDAATLTAADLAEITERHDRFWTWVLWLGIPAWTLASLSNLFVQIVTRGLR